MAYYYVQFSRHFYSSPGSLFKHFNCLTYAATFFTHWLQITMQFSVIYQRYFHQTTENYRSINCQLCKNVSTKRLNNHQVISPSFDLGNQLIKKKVDINWAPIRGGVLSVRSEWMLTVLFVGEPVLPPFTGDRPPFGCRGAHEALNNLVVCRHITAETNKHSKDARFSSRCENSEHNLF